MTVCTGGRDQNAHRHDFYTEPLYQLPIPLRLHRKKKALVDSARQ